MKSLIFPLLIVCFCTALFAEVSTVHDFKVTSISGEEVNLSDYKGKVLLIVNTASKCGFTRQYADLVSLQKAYADQEVVVLGFPANNFGNQEPGTDRQIMEFCSTKFGVNFPMFSKVSVKGADKNPLFTYLTTTENKTFKGDVKWNFEKFLVDQDGVLHSRFRSNVKPDGEVIRKAIDGLLASGETK